MKRSAFILFIFLCIVCSAKAQQQSTAGKLLTQFPSNDKNAGIAYKIIPSVNNSWGYDIFIDHRLTIHQSSIPGLPGNEGFATKENATKVAMLVVSKIKKGSMPPSVTKEEMKKLNAIK